MSQYIILKNETRLNVQSIISLGSFPNEVIEIKFEKEESFEKLFNIYSKNSDTFDQTAIEEFSIYTINNVERKEEEKELSTLQGIHYGFCNLVSIKYEDECCYVKLEKLSDYDMTINEIKKSIKTESNDTNARVLELENILFDLMFMKQNA